MKSPFVLRATVLTTLVLGALGVQAQSTFEFKAHKPGLQVTSGSSTPVTPPSPPPAAPGVGVFGLSSASVDFGSVATNTSTTRQILVSNTGTGSFTFTAVPAVTGDTAFAAGTSSCGASLAVGGECLSDVLFAPTTVGSYNGLLTFRTSLVGSPHDVTLVGTAFNPVSLTAAPLPLARLNQPYAGFDFKSVLLASNETTPQTSLARWQVLSGSLPSGLNLNTTTGVLSGTPTAVPTGEGAGFTVLATYKNNEGQQVYTLRVGDDVLEAVQVSAGSYHTCAVTTSGAAKCWGFNNNGQLGDGTVVDKYTPTAVVGLSSGVTSISAGFYHTCAVQSGTALCWGAGGSGRLGHGSSTASYTPVQVRDGSATGPALTGVTQVVAGITHSCAVHAGAAKCWGANSDGQVGDGSTTTRNFAVQVSGLTGQVSSVTTGGTSTVGGYFSCAIHNGAAKCWGNQLSGRLGNTVVTDTGATTPQSVVGLTSGVTVLSGGGYHACAIHNGAAKCWGSQSGGRLGNGTTSGSSGTPVSVTGLGSGVTVLDVGADHACAVQNGAAKCWGTQADGRLGNGLTSGTASTAVAVTGLGTATADLTAGLTHTCATTTTGDTKCWGNGVYGRLGTGDVNGSAVPLGVAP